jgi:hypothetical protein
MKIFKELNKLGYKHYTENTVEELDDFPLDSEERIMEQALVLRWFREKHGLNYFIELEVDCEPSHYNAHVQCSLVYYGKSYEEAELACLKKLIELSTPITNP